MRQFNALTSAAVGFGLVGSLALSGCGSPSPQEEKELIIETVWQLNPAERVAFDYAGGDPNVELPGNTLGLNGMLIISRQDCLAPTPFNPAPEISRAGVRANQPPIITLIGKDTVVVTPVGATPDQALKFSGYAGDPMKILQPADKHTEEVFAGRGNGKGECNKNSSIIDKRHTR